MDRLKQNFPFLKYRELRFNGLKGEIYNLTIKVMYFYGTNFILRIN